MSDTNKSSRRKQKKNKGSAPGARVQAVEKPDQRKSVPNLPNSSKGTNEIVANAARISDQNKSDLQSQNNHTSSGSNKPSSQPAACISKLNDTQNVEKSVSFSEKVTHIEIVSEALPSSAVDNATAGETAPSDDVTATKSKTELRAERRALQEAQRAAKAARKLDEKDVSKQKNKETVSAGSTLAEGNENSSPKPIVNSSDNVTNEASTKSKAELRAERRAVQEAQRAAKSLNKKDDKKVAVIEDNKDKKPGKTNSAAAVKAATNAKDSSSPPITNPLATLKQVKLVSHLPPHKQPISVVKSTENDVHPAIIKLGLQYAHGTISGSSSRCFQFIQALIKVIQDFKMPADKDFSVAVYSMCIEPAVNFLETCRPISVGMKNICKMLREEISNISKDVSDDEVKRHLVDTLKLFIENHIIKAHKSIVNLAKDKITSKDVIVTYGCSYIVKRVLKAAHETCKFRVVVVDGRPKMEGRSMLRYLVENGIECTYVQINALAHIMPEATKVFLGAHALLANGCVMSRVGSSQVALMAKAFNKPVLVCCETYKFSDMVQTDSFVINELGDPEDLVKINQRNNPLSTWQSENTLNILNVYYDITPPDLVTVLINEGYVVPCTSVPVVLRVRPRKS